MPATRATDRLRRQTGRTRIVASGEERVLLAPVIFSIVGLIAYAGVFSAPFVFDDEPTVVTNTHIRELWSFDALGAPVQSSLSGRPVVALSFAVSYALGQLDPWGYRLLNLGIHVLAALLLYGIARRTLSSPRMPAVVQTASTGLAWVAGLIWLVHPLNTEVVDYVTQRTEALMGLFYLLTMYAVIRAFRSREHPRRWYVLAVGACLLGMASKESMVTAPVMVLLYDIVFEAGSLRRALQERRWLYLGLFATWVPLAALIAPGPRWRSAGFNSGVSPWTYLLNQPGMILTYLKLAIWPSPLVLDYGPARATTLAAELPRLGVPLVLLVASALVWTKSRPLGFLVTWFWITLAPTSSIIPIATEVGAERRMYLPLMAVTMLAVLGGFHLAWPRRARRRGLAPAVAVAVCGVLAWTTIIRNREYHSAVGIWQTVLDRRPQPRAHYNAGLALTKAGRNREAMEHLRIATSEEPRAHYALAVGLEKEGKFSDAEREYKAFLEGKPDDSQAPEGHVRLGVVLNEQDKTDEAIGILETAIRMRPQNPDPHNVLGDVLMKQGKYQEASRHYSEYVRRVQDNPGAYENFAMSLVEQQREPEAIPLFERAVLLQPRDAGTRLRLGNALAAAGRLDAAIAQYRQGIALVPESPNLRRMLAVALLRAGRPEDALSEIERALALQPDDPEMRVIYEQLKRTVPVR